MSGFQNQPPPLAQLSPSPLAADLLDAVHKEWDRVVTDTWQYGILLDKSLITISGASFTLTLSFLGSLIPIPKAEWKLLLLCSIILLGLTIVVTCLSFYVTVIVGQKILEGNRKFRQTGDKDDLFKPFAYNTYICWVDRLKMTLFLLGMSGLMSFVGYNGWRLWC